MENQFGLPPRRTSTRVLLTADEAYAALEEAFLDAKTKITACFAVFDLTTKLQSERGRRVGESWADLVAVTLRRGVAFDLTIADFDPIARPAAHRASWTSVRLLKAIADGIPDAKLNVNAVEHSATTGIWSRVGIWPMILWRQMQAARWLNRQPDLDRTAALDDMPGLGKSLVARRNGRLRVKVWPVAPFYPSVHHQKMAVFDSCVLYIGGLDVEDRSRSGPSHADHDVQLIMQGPVVAEAEAQLSSFINVVAGPSCPPVTRRLLRTLSRRRSENAAYFGPEPVVQDIAAAHEAMIRRSRHLIYVETEYFRDVSLTQKLEQAALENPDLSMILIIPGGTGTASFEGEWKIRARYDEYLQSWALKCLTRAFGPRLFVGGFPKRRTARDRGALQGASLAPGRGSVSIFDDQAAIVSSASLSHRSLRWDTEAGVLLNTPHEMDDLRHRVMAHWLPVEADEGCFGLQTAAAAWQKLAERNAASQPSERRGFLLPYASVSTAQMSI